MYRVYIGNLDSTVTEEDLRDLLEDFRLQYKALVLKRTYAFVDCEHKEHFDNLLQQLDGYSYCGSNLHVEAAAISKRIRSNDLLVHNLPLLTSQEAVQTLFSRFGPITSICLAPSNDASTVSVVFESSEDAKRALAAVDNTEYKGKTLKVEYHDSRGSVPSPVRLSHADHPLRMLVSSELIGAVIGRKGQCIRATANVHNVKIDVHGKEHSGLSEKLVCIHGTAENTSNACKDIMAIVIKNSQGNSAGESALKLLVDDQYCGRVIGREGRSIKEVREQSGSKISISNVQEMAVLYPDRVICIRGSLENMHAAQVAICGRLLECYRKEETFLSRPSHSTSSGRTPQPSHSAESTSNYPETTTTTTTTTPYETPSSLSEESEKTSQQQQQQQRQQQQQKHKQQQQQISHVGIPNYAVGAVIGSGGVNIKRIIRDSNALVTVESRRTEQLPSEERIATIKGSADSCWRASYFIFEKMRQEGFADSDGEVRLRTIMTIPRSVAGRVVGRGGRSVREVQRITGAMIKLSADVRRLESGSWSGMQAYSQEQQDLILQQQAKHHKGHWSTDQLVLVEIYGTFIATQGAQARVRSVLSKVSLTSTLESKEEEEEGGEEEEEEEEEDPS